MTEARTRLSAISLDLDGTLYSIRRMVLGHPATFLRLRRFFRSLHAVRDQLRGQGPVVDLRAEQAVLLGRALGIPTGQAAERIEQVIDREWMAVFNRLKPFPGRVGITDIARMIHQSCEWPLCFTSRSLSSFSFASSI